jgi:hypothetical protein
MHVRSHATFVQLHAERRAHVGHGSRNFDDALFGTFRNYTKPMLAREGSNAL